MRELPRTRLVLISPAHYAHEDPVRLRDHDDLGLSDEGRSQAECLRNRIAMTGELAGATHLLTSKARRAIETARTISPALDHLTPESDCGFCDPHSGECDGMPVSEWQATLAKERLANWSPYAPKSSGGESVRVAIERASRALIEAVIANAGGNLVVITHSIPIRASMWTFLGLPFHGLYADPEVDRTGITEWMCDGWLPGTGQVKARLVRFNDHGHLCSLPPSQAAKG